MTPAEKALKDFTDELVRLARAVNSARAALEAALPASGVIASGNQAMVDYVSAKQAFAEYIFVKYQNGLEIHAAVEVVHHPSSKKHLIKAIKVNGMVGDPGIVPDDYSSKSSSSSV